VGSKFISILRLEFGCQEGAPLNFSATVESSRKFNYASAEFLEIHCNVSMGFLDRIKFNPNFKIAAFVRERRLYGNAHDSRRIGKNCDYRLGTNNDEPCIVRF